MYHVNDSLRLQVKVPEDHHRVTEIVKSLTLNVKMGQHFDGRTASFYLFMRILLC